MTAPKPESRLQQSPLSLGYNELVALVEELQREVARLTPSHGGERSMPAMTDTLLSEMIEAWFAEHPVEPYIKREDEPEFFKRVERVYRAVERRMTPSATAGRTDIEPFRDELMNLLGRWERGALEVEVFAKKIEGVLKAIRSTERTISQEKS